jgi:hypothetical protein
MQKPVVFHEDVFYTYFRPLRHPSSSFNIWGGHGLETFGKDLQIVKNYAENFVWTVLDGCEGPDQWITAGFHWVNRVCYLLTEVPHNWVQAEFRIEHRPRFLTNVGLSRRVSTLRRLMHENDQLLTVKAK